MSAIQKAVRTYAVSLDKPEGAGAQPSFITLIAPENMDRDKYQLFIDHHPVANANWRLSKKNTLSWYQQESGKVLSGHIQFQPNFGGGHGCIRMGGKEHEVSVDSGPVTYTCDVSPNAGASATRDEDATLLEWDKASKEWGGATWTERALRFTYGLKHRHQGGTLARASKYVVLEDVRTGKVWPPDGVNYATEMEKTEYVFTLTEGARLATGGEFEHGAQSAFPWHLQFHFDGTSSGINGAVMPGAHDVRTGMVYAVKGVAINNAVAGLYRLKLTSGSHAVVAIHGGRLLIDQTPVAGSVQAGNTVYWAQSDAAKQVGLPATGSLVFAEDGATVTSGSGVSSGTRITGEDAGLCSAGTMSEDPEHREELREDSAGLDITTLLNMSAYEDKTVSARDGTKTVVQSDTIQQAAMSDFYRIVEYFIPDNLRKYFKKARPRLEPEVLEIAKRPGKNGTTPETWYRKLAVAYITTNLAQVRDSAGRLDPGAQKLNARRAQKWIQAQIAESDVFQVHLPALYRWRWQQRWPETLTFLEDQKDSATYADVIDKDLKEWTAAFLADTSPASQAMVDQYREIASAGKNGRYWAYRYFRAVTSHNSLNDLLLDMKGDNPLEFQYRIQRHVTVLNMLDPDGVFARWLTQVLQVFQLTHLLPDALDYFRIVSSEGDKLATLLLEFASKHGPDSDSPSDLKKLAAAINAQGDEQGVGAWLENLVEGANTTTDKLEVWKKADLRLGASGAGQLLMTAAYALSIWKLISGDEDESESDTGDGWKTAQAIVDVITAGTTAVQATATRAAQFLALGDQRTMELVTGILFQNPEAVQRANAALTGGVAAYLGKTEAAAELAQAGAGKVASKSMWRKFLGDNLTDFIGRVGFVVGAVGLVIAFHDLLTSKTAWDVITNLVNLIGAAAETVGQTLTFLAGAGLITTGGAWGSIIAILGVTATVFAVLGVALALGYLAWKCFQRTDIEVFADTEAHAQGFKMSRAAADYLELPNEAKPEWAAVAIEVIDHRSKSDRRFWLGIADDRSVCLLGKRPTVFARTTSWFVTTDADGWTTISAFIKDDKGRLQRVALTAKESKVYLTEIATEPEHLKTQQWRWNVSNPCWSPSEDDASRVLSSGDGSLCNRALNEFLKIGNHKLLSFSPDPRGDKWDFSATPTEIEAVEMADIKLRPNQRNARFRPTIILGTPPKAFEVKPALPPFMELEAKTGTVSQKKGVAPANGYMQRHTLVADNGIGKKKEVTFQLQVEAAT